MDEKREILDTRKDSDTEGGIKDLFIATGMERRTMSCTRQERMDLRGTPLSEVKFEAIRS